MTLDGGLSDLDISMYSDSGDISKRDIHTVSGFEKKIKKIKKNSTHCVMEEMGSHHVKKTISPRNAAAAAQ